MDKLLRKLLQIQGPALSPNTSVLAWWHISFTSLAEYGHCKFTHVGKLIGIPITQFQCRYRSDCGNYNVSSTRRVNKIFALQMVQLFYNLFVST